MSSSISNVPGVNGRSGGPDPSRAASQAATKMMRELDTDKSGTLDKKEFVSGQVAKGVSTEDAGKQFDAIDSQKTGSIDKAALQTAIQEGQFKPPAGPRPADGGSGPVGGGATPTYDPADTNKDGKVSIPEELVYQLSQEAKLTTTSTNLSKLGANVDEKV